MFDDHQTFRKFCEKKAISPISSELEHKPNTMETLLLANRRRVCRTCLRIVDSRKNLTSILEFDPANKNKLKISFSDMLRLVTNEIVSVLLILSSQHHSNFIPLQISPFDELPKRICEVCVHQIRASFQFRVNAETSYQTLIRTFGLAPPQTIETQVKVEKMREMPVIETENHEQVEQMIPTSQENFFDLLEEISS